MNIRGLLQDYETTPAPGTDESGSGVQAPPAAEPSNTDRGAPPETVPYARFKEVNDRLKSYEGFEPLVKMGYDPDSLGQLATFEAQWYRDPLGTIKGMVDQLDLPDDRKDALKESFDSSMGDTTVQPAEGRRTESGDGADEPPAWAKPLLDDHQKRTAAETEQGNQQMVDKMVEHWKQLDKAENLKETTDKVILRYIASLNPRGDLTTLEQMAEAARTEFYDDRESLLGDAVQRPNGPRAVPGGGVVPTEPEDFGGDIQKATRAAKLALEAGTLPGVTK